jgi:hypothetical protein
MIKSELLLLLFLAIKVPGKCQVAPLSASSKIPSDTIVSGTVKSFFLRGSGGTFAGKVKVGRVFRGDKEMEGRMVMVEGFGSKHVCKSTPRLGDTKLFFLKHINMKRSNHSHAKKFKIYSSIQKVNLRNLKTLSEIEAQEGNGKFILN